MIQFAKDQWALILGGSSGFGLATAKKLAKHGMNIAIAHRDRKGAMPPIEREFAAIQETGVAFRAFNVDALSVEGRGEVLSELTQTLGERGRFRLLLHSIAFGNLKLVAPMLHVGESAARARARLAERLGTSAAAVLDAIEKELENEGSEALLALAGPPAYDQELFLEEEDFTRTVHAMGTSLATWAQDVHTRGLFAEDARVLAMTSEGNAVAWRGYAAVSAAKAALESVSRALAVELAPYGIRSNIVQAGVTDTPALRRIPGSDHLKADAKLRNPFGRLTTPADVADVICLLATDEARWINGALIRVDGGEHIAG
jgi:NAD(P)-dependent dehydrogenase (short-subunit alcohol dehydrogenase family)